MLLEVQGFPLHWTHLPLGPNLGSGNSHYKLAVPVGHFIKDTKTKTPRLWSLEYNVVLSPELQSVSAPDLFAAAHTSEIYFLSFFNQAGHVHLFPLNVPNLDL